MQIFLNCQAQVLNHQAGLANAALEEISRDPFSVCDIDFMLELISESTPEHEPGEQTKYHYLTFGWIVEGLVRGVTGGSLREFVRQNIGEKLNIEDEFMMGIPSQNDGIDGEVNNGGWKEMDKVKETSEKESNVNSRIADLVLGRIVMPSPPPAPPAPTTPAVVVPTVVTAAAVPSDAPIVTGAVSTPPPISTDTSTMKADTEVTPPVLTEEITTRSFKKRPPSGPSMLMNPTFFNNPRIR